MRTDHTSRDTPDRMDTVFIGADPRTSEPRSASIDLVDPGQHRGFVPNIQMPPTLRNEMAEFLVDVDGLHIVVRFLVKELFAEMRSSFVAKGADIRSLRSSTLERMVDRKRGSSLRSNDPSKQPLAIVELISSGGSLIRPRAQPNETALRVGSLELDLIDRSAKRGDRQIDLRPREFQLLKYMMQRSGQLLTRVTLFKEVWHYKFDPETNLVDVHMGRLRRKVDGSNEAPMIRNVRGAGFVLSATPISQGSPTRPLNDQPIWPSELGLRGQWKGDGNDN